MVPAAPNPGPAMPAPASASSPSGPWRVDPQEPVRPPLPRQGFGWLAYLNYLFGISLCITLDKLWLRMKVTGLENIPARGPFLLLPNHTTFLDPFIICYPILRPMRYMAAAGLLRIPILGSWLRALGSFPKMKYVKDPASMATTQALWDQDQLITIFPEGRRTWDGDPTEVSDGIGRLIQRLDARVVFATLENAYLMHPRWARYPRRVPLRLRYEGPFRYPADWTPEQVAEDVRQRVRAPQRIEPGQSVWTFRMAHGLPNLLWSCLRCHAVEGLQVDPTDDDAVRCRSCGAAWRLDVETRLHPKDGVGPTLTVREAYRQALAHFAYPPRLGEALPASGELVMEGARATLRRVGARSREVVARGALRLFTDRLDVVEADGRVALSLPLDSLRALSVEVGNQVQVRQGDLLYDIQIADESVLRWGHFIKGWMNPGEVVDIG